MIDTHVEIMGSPSEYEKFMESYIYKDFLAELEIREAYIQSVLIDDDLQFSGREYDKARGCLKDIVEMKDIFLSLLANKLDDIENEEEEEDDS